MSKTILIVASTILLAALIAGAVVMTFRHNEVTVHRSHYGNADGDIDINTSKKAVEAVCQPTNYRDTCVKSISGAAGNTTDPRELIQIGFKVAKEEIGNALAKSKTIQAAKNDPRSAQALEICHEVVSYAVEDLEKSVNSMATFNTENMDSFLEDMKVWLGGAVTYQDVCFDAFENATDTEPGLKMRQFFNVSKQLTSNALALLNEVKTVAGLLDLGTKFGINVPAGRRLLKKKDSDDGSTELAGHLPSWITDAQRQILDKPLDSIKPDVVVALDGSSKFKHINQALNQIPKDNNKPFIVYIKGGVYREHVTVTKKMTNVIFIGDGPTKTVITGNRSFKDGWATFKTATVAIMAEGFMARDIGFENTAGPEGHQAVAIRVAGDFAIFLNCRFDGYQDTLYPVRSRQFYRDCTISGTIDFIFGDAQVVFQNCEIIVKKPMENQNCMVTAQGRTDKNGPGVTVLHNCTISGAKDYMAVKDENVAYLGRPWKEYSRTIVMQSYISDAIAPEGWTPWTGSFALETLFYAEYENRGPGADQSRRVKWTGIKKLDSKEIEKFTPEKLYEGNQWIAPSGAPYASGMVKV